MDHNYEYRVTRGMALLDNAYPNWMPKIDLAQLDIAHARKCVLGQLFGQYAIGLGALGLNFPNKPPFAYGFAVMGDNNQLTQAWREAIGARRAAELTKQPIAVS